MLLLLNKTKKQKVKIHLLSHLVEIWRLKKNKNIMLRLEREKRKVTKSKPAPKACHCESLCSAPHPCCGGRRYLEAGWSVWGRKRRRQRVSGRGWSTAFPEVERLPHQGHLHKNTQHKNRKWTDRHLLHQTFPSLQTMQGILHRMKSVCTSYQFWEQLSLQLYDFYAPVCSLESTEKGVLTQTTQTCATQSNTQRAESPYCRCRLLRFLNRQLPSRTICRRCWCSRGRAGNILWNSREWHLYYIVWIFTHFDLSIYSAVATNYKSFSSSIH